MSTNDGFCTSAWRRKTELLLQKFGVRSKDRPTVSFNGNKNCVGLLVTR